MKKTALLAATAAVAVAFGSCAKKESQAASTASVSSNGVSKSAEAAKANSDWKRYINEYEAFMDEYIAYMKKMSENPSDLSAVTKIAELSERAEKFAQSGEKLQGELTGKDLEEFTQSYSRIMKKMLEVSGAAGTTGAADVDLNGALDALNSLGSFGF